MPLRDPTPDDVSGHPVVSGATAPLFPFGTIVATPAALALLVQHGVSPQTLLSRHLSGDWGDLGEDDRQENAVSLARSGRLLSSYAVTESIRVWIITEADRSATTVLLPDEY